VNGEPKLVPESDLMALKAKLEKETGELQSQLEQAKNLADTHYANLLKEQAQAEAIRAELSEAKKELEELRGLKSLKEQAEAKVAELENKLLDVERQRLIQVYKLPEEKLQGKTLAELKAIEEAIQLVGMRTSSRYATGVGGEAAPLSAFDKIKQGLEQLT